MQCFRQATESVRVANVILAELKFDFNILTKLKIVTKKKGVLIVTLDMKMI